MQVSFDNTNISQVLLKMIVSKGIETALAALTINKSKLLSLSFGNTKVIPGNKFRNQVRIEAMATIQGNQSG